MISIFHNITPGKYCKTRYNMVILEKINRIFIKIYQKWRCKEKVDYK